jgi:branched-chain amino acid transport system substrate-binding protein
VTTLRAGLVTPLSGPLARYGRAGASALTLWADRAAQLSAGFSRVEVEVVDAHPSAAVAMHAAAARQPHVLFGPYGSGPAVAALGATERLVWNHGGATDRLRWPRVPHVLNVPAPAVTYFAAVLRALRAADASLHSVSLLHGRTGFAREVAQGALEAAASLNFEVDAREFAPGEVDAVCSNVRPADVLLVVGSFDDERSAARKLLPGAWRAACFVAAGVDEVLADIGDRRADVLGPCQWLASAAAETDEGPAAGWFVDAFRDATGENPSYPAAAAFAAGVRCARAVRDADSVEPEAIRRVVTAMRARTLFGPFALDPESGLQVGQQVLVTQWQDGARQAVWPPAQATTTLRLRPRAQ